MIRGLLSGVSLGAVVSAGVLSVASLLAPQPAGNTPPQPPKVEVPAPADTSPASEAAPLPEGGVMTEPPSLTEAPGVAPPAPDAPTALIDTQAGPAPDADALETTLIAPEAQAAPDLAGGEEEPVLPSPQTASPEVPTTEADLTISAPATGGADQTATAESPVVVIDPVPAPDPASPAALAQSPAMTAPEMTEALPAPTGEAGTTPAKTDPVQPASPAPEVAVSAESDVAIPDAAGSDSPETLAMVAPGDTGAAPEPITPEQPAPESAPAPDATAPAPDTTPSADAPAPPPAGAAPAVGLTGQAATTMPTGTSAVRINRPGAEPSAIPAPEPEGGEAGLPVISGGGSTALERYSQAVTPPEGLPLMSIVLIDDGSMAGGPEALAAAGVPVSVAITVGAQNSSALMQAYRAKGIEVVALMVLPQGALASDAAVAAEVARTDLPEAIALMFTGSVDRGVTAELLAAAAVEGQGILSPHSGIGGIARPAAEAGVAAAEIGRDLDAEGQDARVIRRFMDRAAFEARQSGSVVLLGRVRPDTISALIMWSTANRSDQVAQVPVSAILKASLPDQ